ncbi:MAG: accessory factor UbiK family protein [Alphaproteobacteria bacterium]|nr:accessory factor UbiK family protein [Alphaproteobacteria bacterium]
MAGDRLRDDMAGVAGGALSALAGLRRELAAMVQARVDACVARLQLVPREEFEAVREMAARARAEQEKLAARLAELEARLAAPDGQAGD